MDSKQNPTDVTPSMTPAEITWHGDFKLIDVDMLTPDPNQPRKTFSDAALAELSKTILSNGVVQPIIVRRANGDGHHEIIMGERRWRAAKLAGVKSVPVVLRDMDREDAYEAQLVENLSCFRVDLDMIEKARGVKHLIDKHGDQEKVAKRLGKSQSWVANAIAFLDVPPRIMELSESNVVRDKTTLVALKRLSDASPEAADELIQAAKSNNGIARDVVTNKLQEISGGNQRTKSSKMNAGEAPKAAEEGLAEAVKPDSKADEQRAVPVNDGAPEVVAAPRKRIKVDKIKKATEVLGLPDNADLETILEGLIDRFLGDGINA